MNHYIRDTHTHIPTHTIYKHTYTHTHTYIHNKQTHIHTHTHTLIRVLTYGAPVWDEALIKQINLRVLQRTQRLINIKIAKAFRTISFEASCVKVGVPPIGIVIEGKVRTYKATRNNF